MQQLWSCLWFKVTAATALGNRLPELPQILTWNCQRILDFFNFFFFSHPGLFYFYRHQPAFSGASALLTPLPLGGPWGHSLPEDLWCMCAAHCPEEPGAAPRCREPRWPSPPAHPSLCCWKLACIRGFYRDHSKKMQTAPEPGRDRKHKATPLCLPAGWRGGLQINVV